MTPTRVSNLLAVAIAVGVAVWLGLHFSYANLPPLPWSAVPTLGIIGLAEMVTARNTRARIRGQQGTRPIHPIVVARLVVFAKAGAYTAAAAGGAFAAVLVFVAPELGRGVGEHDVIVAGTTLAVAIFMAGMALLLEHVCRVPRSPDDRFEGRR